MKLILIPVTSLLPINRSANSFGQPRRIIPHPQLASLYTISKTTTYTRDMSLSSFFGRKPSKTTNPEPVSIDIWDPLEGLSLAATLAAISSVATASMDWKETQDAHVFIADLPGVKKDEIKIEVEEEKILKISGQRSRESEEKGDRWHHVERSAERFLRSVKLPSNASVERMKAALQDGVLIVTVPKDPEKKVRGRFIQITD